MHLVLGGPEVAQVDLFALVVGSQRVLVEVDVHRPGQRVGHAQRGRGEVVHLHVLVDAALEVAVAREHRADGEVALVDRGGDLVGQRAGVPDARGAAVADEVELQRLEVLGQPGAVQVLGDDLGAGGERGLDPRLDVQAPLDRVAGENARPDHHRRVRGVRAAGDGGDHDVAVVQLELLAVHRDTWTDAAVDVTAALDGTGLGSARMAAVPRRRVGGREGVLDVLVVAVAVGHVALQGLLEGLLRVDERDAVLRALRSGERGDDVAQVELEALRVRGLLAVLVVPEALLLRVGLDELDLLLGAAGELQVAQRLGVDREDRARRAELRRHVADGRPVGQRQVGQAGPVELDELADHAVLAQHLGDGQDEVGGGRALRQLAGELEPHDLGDEHRHGLAEHRRLGLDPAHAPAQYAEAVDHRGVRVGADEGVGVGLTGRLVVEDDPSQVLEVDLVDDARVGRHDLEAVEGALAPAKEGVALLVALELQVGVHLEGPVGPERVHLHRVVDHELRGDQRVDLLRRRRPVRASRRAWRRGRRRRGRR